MKTFEQASTGFRTTVGESTFLKQLYTSLQATVPDVKNIICDGPSHINELVVARDGKVKPTDARKWMGSLDGHCQWASTPDSINECPAFRVKGPNDRTYRVIFVDQTDKPNYSRFEEALGLRKPSGYCPPEGRGWWS